MCSGLCVGLYNTAYLCQEWIDFPQACLPTVSQHCVMRQPGLNLSEASLQTTSKRQKRERRYSYLQNNQHPPTPTPTPRHLKNPSAAQTQDTLQQIDHQHRKPSAGIQKGPMLPFWLHFLHHGGFITIPELSAHTERGKSCLFFKRSPNKWCARQST